MHTRFFISCDWTIFSFSKSKVVQKFDFLIFYSRVHDLSEMGEYMENPITVVIWLNFFLIRSIILSLVIWFHWYWLLNRDLSINSSFITTFLECSFESKIKIQVSFTNSHFMFRHWLYVFWFFCDWIMFTQIERSYYWILHNLTERIG